MIGHQYKIKGIAQAETIRHKRDIEQSLQIKKQFKAFSEDSIDLSRPGHFIGEMYTKIHHNLLAR